MRILMLGNSFTFANDMPAMLAELTGAEVVHHTRGGARLAEQLNPKTKTGAKTQAALENEFWDYVVLQEMSNGPVTSRNSFLKNAGRLCAWIEFIFEEHRTALCLDQGGRGLSSSICHLGLSEGQPGHGRYGYEL